MKREMALGTFGASPRHLAHAARSIKQRTDEILAEWLPEAVNILRSDGWTTEDFSRAELEDECRYALERLRWRLTNDPHAERTDEERERFRLLGGLQDLDTDRDARLVAVFKVFQFLGHVISVVLLSDLPDDWTAVVAIETRAKVMGALSLGTGFPTPCGFVDAVEDRLRQRQAETADVFRRMLGAQEDERKRLSRDIHDVLAQTLATCHYRAETCALILDRDPEAARSDMLEVAGLISSTLDQVRDIIFDLRPSALDRGGLADAIGAYIDRMVGSDQPVRFTVRESADTSDLDDRIKTALYRIAQEGVSNVLHHSGAERAAVVIEREHDRVELTITDEGDGFDAEKARLAQADGHIGLASMRERCELLGGSFELRSEPGRGTRVRVRVPLSPPLRTHA